MIFQQHAPAKGLSPLIKRVVRGLFQIIGGLGVGLLVAVLLVAWRLASGPVSIGFLTPYIQNALSEVHKDAIALEVEDTILTWAGWERTLDIRIVNLQTSLPDGQVVATVPEVSLSLSAEALLKGNVAPRSIEFFGPTFHVERLADGQFALGFEQAQQTAAKEGDLVASLILLMLQDPNPDQALSYLKRISVVDGQLIYEDKAEGSLWQASETSADFIRVDGGLEAELDMTLKGANHSAGITVMGTYTLADKQIDLGVQVDGLVPADFTELVQSVPMLATVDLPLNGTLTLSMLQDGVIEGVDFDVQGGAGHLALPVNVAAELNALPWAQRLGVDGLSAKGHFEGGTQSVKLDDLTINLPKGETFHIPAPVNHEYEIRELKTELSFYGDQGLLDVRRLELELGQGPRALVSALIDGLGAGRSELGIDIKGQIAGVAFNDLNDLWPQSLAIDARDWVVPNLRDGVAEDATIEASLNVDADGAIVLENLSGEVRGGGLTVDYLSPMPPATQARGRATFNADEFNIEVFEGKGYKGLSVTSGTIDLTKLQEDTAEAHIDINVEGPVQAVLELIDYEPLAFASELGIKPGNVGGAAKGNVKLSLPLLLDLKASDVVAKANATVADGSIQEALFKKDLSKGDLKLNVDNDGLALTGEAVLGIVPIELDWKHDFREAALFRDRYELSGSIEDVLSLSALGIEVPDILSRYMAGGAEANVNYTEFSNGTEALSARVDLSNISLAAPELGWAKPTGVPGTAELELRLKNHKPQEIPKFGVTAPDMDIAGSAFFADDGSLLRIDINTMKSGHTDVSGSLTPDIEGAWELVLRGESLDAQLLWDEMLGIYEAPPRKKLEDDELSLTVAVDIHTLRLRQDRALNDLVGTVYRENGGWRKIDISAAVGDGGGIELLLDTDRDGLRYLSITSDDAGSSLRALDLHDNILGGDLDLKAAYTSPSKDAPLEGVLKVTDYAMIDAPAFAKLIGVMSLTGVLDALQGEGLNFDIFEAPFKLEGGQLEMVSSRASGPTIGVTASGTVDMDNKLMNLEGTVVPAYAINALLGKIPIIGDLFTGGEKGGGLFAATYTMVGTKENVEITVNPLSVLTPGVLRGIFSGSDKEKEIPTVPPKPKAAPVEPVTPAPIN
ncbi:AsmA-like C-terminal region-containing protein [Magnetovibrio sp. PR-2]|uniref:YhdP family protein n=1 Tax=Magnetovibrio sp. PR-2 TaxID=3120356 RepID=UPI002FCE478A